jgi:3-oxosteroid 1-dehydrogenase
MTWPDYHPEMEGAKAEGRMLEPALYDTHRLGPWAGRLRRPPVLGLPIPLQEATVEWRPSYTPEKFDAAAVKARVAAGQVACGQALIGALLEACLAVGIEPRLGTRATEITMGRGAQRDRVTGLVVEEDGHRRELPAAAVVLASGGYEWNTALRSGSCPGRSPIPTAPRPTRGTAWPWPWPWAPTWAT